MNNENQEAINGLLNSIQDKMNNTNDSISNTTEEVQSSSGIDLSSILGMLNSNSSNESSSKSSDSSFDPALLLKIQKVMGAMNKNNSKKDLLLSLKPFLRQSRQDKIGEYITILNVISMLDSFRDKDKDKNQNKGSD